MDLRLLVVFRTYSMLFFTSYIPSSVYVKFQNCGSVGDSNQLFVRTNWLVTNQLLTRSAVLYVIPRISSASTVAEPDVVTARGQSERQVWGHSVGAVVDNRSVVVAVYAITGEVSSIEDWPRLVVHWDSVPEDDRKGLCLRNIWVHYSEQLYVISVISDKSVGLGLESPRDYDIGLKSELENC